MAASTWMPWEVEITSAWRIYDLIDGFAESRGTHASPARPQGTVRFTIVATETGGIRTDLGQPLPLDMTSNPSGAVMWFGAVRAIDGRRFQYPVGPPAVVVQITSDHHQQTEDVFIAAERATTATQLDLQPGYNYPFPTATTRAGALGPTIISGRLLTANGRGEPGALIDLVPLPPAQQPPGPSYLTDLSGRWALPFDDTVSDIVDGQIRIRRPNVVDELVTEVQLVAGETTSLSHATLAGTARRTGGQPLPGVSITANLLPGRFAVTGHDGRFLLAAAMAQFPPSGGPRAAVVTATPPSGPSQQRDVTIQPRATERVAEFVFP